MAVVYDKLGRFDLSDRYYDKAEQADPGSRIVAMDRRYSMMLRNVGQGQPQIDSAPVLAQVQPAPQRAPAPSRAAAPTHVRLLADARGVMRIAPAQRQDKAPRVALASRTAPQPKAAPVVLSPTDRPPLCGRQCSPPYQKRDYGVAIGVLRQARDLSPSDARILTALGVTYDHLGRFRPQHPLLRPGRQDRSRLAGAGPGPSHVAIAAAARRLRGA